MKDSAGALDGVLSFFDPETSAGGTIQNPVTNWAPGIQGVSAFNGDGETFVLIPTSELPENPFNVDENFTFAAWIRTSQENAGPIWSLRPRDSGDLRGGPAICVCGGEIALYIPDVWEVRSGGFVADGEWHHIAVVVEQNLFEDDKEGVQSFIDGKPRAPKAVDFQRAGRPSMFDVKIGSATPAPPTCGPPSFVGQIDTLQWFDFVLFEDAIAALSADGAPNGCPEGAPPNCDEVPSPPCPVVVARGPEGNVEGEWTLHVQVPDVEEASLIYTLDFRNSDHQGSNFSVIQIGRRHVTRTLSPGEWTVFARVTVDLFCDGAPPAGCDPSVSFTVVPNCTPNEGIEATCDDGLDNDCDRDVDRADIDCQSDVIGPFIRGDCDRNGTVGCSPTESIVMLNWAYRGGQEPPCLAACDAEADGRITITDDHGRAPNSADGLPWDWGGGPAVSGLYGEPCRNGPSSRV